MADAVTSQKLIDGDKEVVMKFTNVSDGTGESAVVKIDVSALTMNSLGQTCTGVVIEDVWAMTFGMGVDILWDATADVLALHIPQDQLYHLNFGCVGGIPNNAGAGKTGDVSFTTVGHTAGDRYTVIIKARKTYG